MDRLTTADFNEAVRIRNRPPPGCSKSVTTEQKICARLRRLQKNPGELQKSHKNGFRSAQLPGGARGCACQAPKLVDFRLLLLRLKAVLKYARRIGGAAMRCLRRGDFSARRRIAGLRGASRTDPDGLSQMA